MPETKIVIIGAGPVGVGASHRLVERRSTNWLVLEKTGVAGGIARSETDSRGFTWDCAGHVLFSKDQRFKDFCKNVLRDRLGNLERSSKILASGRWVDYPFQNNIHQLPFHKKLSCLLGLYKASLDPEASPANFEEWIQSSFGSGIADQFLLPYNRKVWSHPLSEMGIYWMNDRVSVIDFKKILKNTFLKKNDAGWGPNAIFHYPKKGGFGSIFSERLEPLKEHVRFNTDVKEIDVEKKEIRASNGQTFSYDWLISAMPIDELVSKIPSSPSTVRQAANGLAYHGVYSVGVGLKRKVTTDFCWAYFPDPTLPFYRVTHLSKYSPFNVPGGDTDTHGSFLCEIPYSKSHPVSANGVAESAIAGLIRAGLMSERDRESVVSTHVVDCPYAYPIPTRDRDSRLVQIQPWLESKQVLSRGRFGTWRYEIGNSDHAFMMGWEAVDKILSGAPETIVR